ncbi:MAG TPA: FAD-dependent monooxygenase [Terracidiphilus sp.]|nr:FAD-dependent monooxygenase [Terracidiphilus sp.]
MRIGEHAVVCGAGIGGLIAARVLSEHFDRVTVIERDALDGGERIGAPQTQHVHVLLRLGVELMEKSFPGIVEEMKKSGVAPLDFGRDLCWLQYGGWMPRCESTFVLYPQTRFSLESHIRRRLGTFANVSFMTGTMVKGLLWSADQNRVIGVEAQAKGSESRCRVEADLVVDAGGRATQFYRWMEQAGYPHPDESKLQIDLCYVSRLYEPTASTRDWRGMWVSPLVPKVQRGGTVQYVEGNRWIVTLFGYHGDFPPHDETGFLEFARNLLHPALYDAIKDAKPVSDVHVYKVHDERWRHLERIKRYPAGLLAIGDAFCYFDPVFGQGMSVAMMEADILRKRLRGVKRAEQLNAAWAKAYFTACSRWIQGVWYFVAGEALRHPQAPGERTRVVRMMQWLVTELYALNSQYPSVYLRFLKLMHLTSGPEVLLHPDISLRLAMRALRQWAGRGARASAADA